MKQESDGRERPKERVKGGAVSPSVKAEPVSVKPRRHQSSGSETDTSVEIAQARKVMERQRKDRERARKDDGTDGDGKNSESEHELPTIPQVVRQKRAGLKKAQLHAEGNASDKHAYFGLGSSGKHQGQDDHEQGKGQSVHQGVKEGSPLLIRHGVNEATQEITSLPRIRRDKAGAKPKYDHGKIMTNPQGWNKLMC